MSDHDWVQEANCIGIHVDIFFSTNKPNPQVVDICAACPVKQVCLESAMREEVGHVRRYGIRGGLLPSQRHSLHEGLRG